MFCAYCGCSAIFLPQGHHSCAQVKSWLADGFVARMGAQLDHQVRKDPTGHRQRVKPFFVGGQRAVLVPPAGLEVLGWEDGSWNAGEDVLGAVFSTSSTAAH